MELRQLKFNVGNLNYDELLKTKDNQISEVIWRELSITKSLYSFLPTSLKFNSSNFVTNGNTYNGIINIVKYPASLYDCWGAGIYAIIHENNYYVEDISLKLTIDKSESQYYQNTIRDDFIRAEELVKTIGTTELGNISKKIFKKSEYEEDEKKQQNFDDYKLLNNYIQTGGLIANVYLSIRFTCDSEENYRKAYKLISSKLKGNGYNIVNYDYLQQNVYKSWLSSDVSWLHNQENITPYETLTNEELPAFIANDVTAHVDNDEYASFIGVNNSNLPVTLSLFPNDTSQRTNHTMGIFGNSGTGKSIFSKKIIKSGVNKGIKYYILDIEGEYIDLAKTFKNHLIFSSNNLTINPCTSLSSSSQDQKMLIQEFFSLILNLDKNSREIILLLKVYSQLESKIKDEEITIFDILNEIKSVIEYEQFSLTTTETPLEIQDKNYLSILKDNLALKCEDSMFNKLFNATTNINMDDVLKADIIVFDLQFLKDLGGNDCVRGYSYLLMKLVDNLIFTTWTKNKEQAQQLVVDEVHLYMENNPYLVSWFNKQAGILRKRNAGITTITQNIKDIINALSGTNNRKIIDDATYKVFFQTEQDSINFLKENNPELNNNLQLQNKIKQLPQHNCIMFVGKKIVDLQVNTTEKDLEDFGSVGK